MRLPPASPPQGQRPAGQHNTGAAKEGLQAWPTSANSEEAGGVAGTPSRQQLLVGRSGAFANPVHPSNMAAAAAGPPEPIPVDATGVPIKNPFGA